MPRWGTGLRHRLPVFFLPWLHQCLSVGGPSQEGRPTQTEQSFLTEHSLAPQKEEAQWSQGPHHIGRTAFYWVLTAQQAVQILHLFGKYSLNILEGQGLGLSIGIQEKKAGRAHELSGLTVSR